jgi:lipopolysaccharide transport system ATP-binding protein
MGTQGAGTSLGWVNTTNAFATQDFIPQSLLLVNEAGEPMKDNLQRGMPVYVEITGRVQFPNASLKIGYVLMGSDGAVLYETDCTDSAQEQWPALEAGFVRLRSPLPLDWLNEGSHHLELIASIHVFKWICRPGNNSPSITFNVTGPLSDSPYWRERREGAIAPQLPWTLVNDTAPQAKALV